MYITTRTTLQYAVDDTVHHGVFYKTVYIPISQANKCQQKDIIYPLKTQIIAINL